MATSYLYILFTITFKLVCILISKRYFWSRDLALCKRWRLGAVWCCYGWQAAASVLLDLQAPLMSKGIVLAALLIILSTEKERGRKLKLPLDTSKQTKVRRVWFIWRMPAIQTSLRKLMSSVIMLNIVLTWSNNLPVHCLQDWGAWKILKRKGHFDPWHYKKLTSLHLTVPVIECKTIMNTVLVFFKSIFRQLAGPPLCSG